MKQTENGMMLFNNMHNDQITPGPKNHESILAACICPNCSGNLNAYSGIINCSGCGSKYPITDGIPSFLQKNDQSRKHGRIAHLYDVASQKYGDNFKSCGYSGQAAYYSRLKIISKWINFGGLSNTKILDIGCGTGMMTKHLAEKMKSGVLMFQSVY